MTTKPEQNRWRHLMYQLARDDLRWVKVLHFIFLFIGCYLVYLAVTAHNNLYLVPGFALLAFWMYLRRPTKPQ